MEFSREEFRAWLNTLDTNNFFALRGSMTKCPIACWLNASGKMAKALVEGSTAVDEGHLPHSLPLWAQYFIAKIDSQRGSGLRPPTAIDVLDRIREE